MDADGNAITTCYETIVKHDGATGRVLWSYDTGHHLDHGLVVDAANNVFASSDFHARTKRFYRLNEEGNATWSIRYTPSTQLSRPAYAGFEVDGLGDLYIAFQTRSAGWSQVGLLKFEPGTSVPVEEAPPVPDALSLDQNHPNPFSRSTQITYTLPAPSDVRLAVYDVLGRRVAKLAEGRRPAGTHRATFVANGRLAGGVYLYRLESGGQVQTRRMVVLP